MLSDEDRDVIMELKVNITQQQERIIFLMRGIDDIKEQMGILRIEQDRRFRWTVLLFISLLSISISVSLAVMMWGA